MWTSPLILTLFTNLFHGNCCSLQVLVAMFEHMIVDGWLAIYKNILLIFKEVFGRMLVQGQTQEDVVISSLLRLEGLEILNDYQV